MEKVYGTTLMLALLAISMPGEAAKGEKCDNGNAPDYTWLQCVVVGEEIECSSVDSEQPGRYVNQDSSSNCLVSVGLELHVTCCSEDLVLFRDDHNLGNHTASCPFATSLESGRYECRWRDNGTSFANRSIVVDGKVYLQCLKYSMRSAMLQRRCT